MDHSTSEHVGIVLAGGLGTRLHPITKGVSKQLLPVYDKPMIYYPISVLMLSGIREILIISTPQDIDNYKRLLGDGENIGVRFSYLVQAKANGIPNAFVLGKDFIGLKRVALVLGDNIFYGEHFSDKLSTAVTSQSQAVAFSYAVKDPQRFGVVETDSSGQAISIEEKPISPKTNEVITGLYFFDNSVIEAAAKVEESRRGETEITDVLRLYMDSKQLSIIKLGRGFAWLDTGTHDSLMDAGHFVQTLENRQGLKIACLEEIAYNSQWIDDDALQKNIDGLKNTSYGEYLRQLRERR